MAVVSIATLKSYFETGDVPTQAQYVDLIDTLSSLAALLGVSGNTQGQLITSNDTNTAIQLSDGEGLFKYALVDILNRFYVYADSIGIDFYDGAVTGNFGVNALKTTVYHDVYINIDAPKITIDQIPTSDAGLSAGQIWSDAGTLKIV